MTFQRVKTWACSQCGEHHEPPHLPQKEAILLSDEAFLDYCASHCETDRAGFVKENLDRLMDLAGEERDPGLIEGAIYSVYPSQMLPMVRRARRWQKWMALLKAIEGNELDLEPALAKPVAEVKAMLAENTPPLPG